ncbi:MAG: hypothetical protein KOO60_12265, partial [Gemmatimonadales bacterium]|nr:hypothetical protein [Gemmatimonadales bacterium]
PVTVVSLATVFGDIEDAAIVNLSVGGNTNGGLVTPYLVGNQLTLAYALNGYGQAEITVVGTDSGGLTVEDTFNVTVNSNNVAPTLANEIADMTVDEDAPDSVVDLSSTFADAAQTPVTPYISFTADILDASTTNGAGVTGEGLTRYTFFLNDAPGDEMTALWVIDAIFTSPGGSGIRNFTMLPGVLDIDIDDEATADTYNSQIDPYYYNKDLDTWLGGDFGWMPGGVPYLIHGPAHESWIPQIQIRAISGLNSPSGAMFLQVVSDGQVNWNGGVARGASGTTFLADGSTGLTLSVESNSNEDLVAASIVGDELRLVYAPGASGGAEITVRATDSEGLSVEDTFTVTVDPAADIVARHVFYNNSSWDAAGGDDAAVAPDKTLLTAPGQTATQANYSNFSRGINGIMVDIEDPAGAITLADFEFKSGASADPATWQAAPTPTLTVRPGAGEGGSDRVTLTWSDGAIANQWLEVTVLATAATDLAAADVFYFGNIIGDTDGDGQVGAGDYATLTSEFGRRGPIGTLAADLNGDGRVSLTDFA